MLSSKLKAYLKLSRPFTLLAPIFGGLIFSYLGYLETGGPRCRILLTPLILALANYVSNVINQIYDRDIDRVNKPYRPIPSGEVSVDGAFSLAILLTLIVLSVSYLINSLFGLLLSIIMAFAWMYSAPPLRLRSKLFWSNIALAAPRGALGILTAYASYANPFEDMRLLVFSLGLAVYVFGGNTFKDFPDEVGDRMFGVIRQEESIQDSGCKRTALIDTFPLLYGRQHLHSTHTIHTVCVIHLPRFEEP
ncbi:MAG: UbiA family prenyltransferase [Nitrososphaerota archaeon]